MTGYCAVCGRYRVLDPELAWCAECVHAWWARMAIE